jgi:hypothetical protein
MNTYDMMTEEQIAADQQAFDKKMAAFIILFSPFLFLANLFQKRTRK